MFSSDEKIWAEKVFGKADFKDPRRNKSVIASAALMAAHPGQSIEAASGERTSQATRTRRLLRNKNVKLESIIAGGCESCVDKINEYDVLLAIQDTTTLAYEHSSCQDTLGTVDSKKNSKKRGWLVHSCILFDPKKEFTIGLINQKWWLRDPEDFGKKSKRKETDYRDKESYKWEDCDKTVSHRVGSNMRKIITVCDRESDIYDYIKYKIDSGERFIVRAAQNRRVENENKNLFDIAGTMPLLGQYSIDLAQRGGKYKRQKTSTIIEVRAKEIELQKPKNRPGDWPLLKVWVVYALEVNHNKSQKPLEWTILTSECVNDLKSARTITSYYAYRWKVEDFHKVWKTGGFDMENLQYETGDAIARHGAIAAFSAIRLMQLQELKDIDEDVDCERVLHREEWICLWMKINPKEKVPNQAPDIKWAWTSLARIAGWKDSKGTGQASPKTLWLGWQRLQNLVDGFRLAKSHFSLFDASPKT